MFEAVFGDDHGFLGGLTALGAVLGGTGWWAARRLRAAHALWWPPFVFCLTGVLGVTLALRAGEGGGPAECVINHEITEPLYTTQGQWNLAMFVPLGFFGVLALRRPAPVLAGALALPCLIELAQTLAPVVGICDSADLEMNAVGGLIGLAAGLLAVRGRVAWRAWVRTSLVLLGALGLIGITVLHSAVTLEHVDGSSVRDAHGDERAVAERVVRQAFDGRYEVGRVQIRPGIDGYNGFMSIQLGGGVSADLMWPGGRRLTVDFSGATGPGFAVPGATPAHDARDAYRIARTYMRVHYPWAGSASWHVTRPATGEQGGDGWVTSWRFRERGVAMPRSLDVRIDRAGRVHGLTADFGPTHVDVPARLLTARQAEEAVTEREQEHGAGPKALRVHALDLMTQRAKGNRGPWRAVWSVEVADPGCEPDGKGEGCDPYVATLDAVTGRPAD
ncbi:VanZ family protein [Streptomyces musisoli]|uniref:VanZ family protein n=1 Tax=Streptomyces musisoli TaxID=2802280 RepID=UPI0027DA47F8|nr:VanZ family protein [Streptomyces musisoli]